MLLLWKLADIIVFGIPIGAEVKPTLSQFQVNFEQKQVGGQVCARLDAMWVIGDLYATDSSPRTGGTGTSGILWYPASATYVQNSARVRKQSQAFHRHGTQRCLAVPFMVDWRGYRDTPYLFTSTNASSEGSYVEVSRRMFEHYFQSLNLKPRGIILNLIYRTIIISFFFLLLFLSSSTPPRTRSDNK